MDNKKYIRKIGSDIHSMSFIIGAGFSKNIYTFNYDNALDVYKDLTYTSERARKIKENE